jgi:hypothetical protein
VSKWCPHCQRELPLEDFGQRHTRTGKPVPDSYCKACRRTLARERLLDPETHARDLARRRAAYRKRRENQQWLAEERERHRLRQAALRLKNPGESAELQRFHYWSEAERNGRALGEREKAIPRYGPRRHYQRPSNHNGEGVPAEPLIAYIRHCYPGWTPYEIARLAAPHSVSVDWVRRLLQREAGKVELEAVDRFLTHGLGRPDLLLALYPASEARL